MIPSQQLPTLTVGRRRASKTLSGDVFWFEMTDILIIKTIPFQLFGGGNRGSYGGTHVFVARIGSGVFVATVGVGATPTTDMTCIESTRGTVRRKARAWTRARRSARASRSRTRLIGMTITYKRIIMPSLCNPGVYQHTL